jgi:hypothetical protein
MNRIKNLRWLYLVAVLFVGEQVRSQAVISFGPFLTPLPDSAVWNTVIIDSLYIFNTGTSSFQGSITFELSVNNGAAFSYENPSNAGIAFYPFDSSSYYFNIPAHGSVEAIVQVYFDSTEFLAGPSVVVIWPALSNESPPGNGIAGDTLKDTVQILYPADISGPLPAGLKVYCDNEQLFIKCDEPNALELVRIFDVSGALILEQHLSTSNTIPMGKFSDGVYLAELTLTSGQQIIYKIFSGR